MLLYIPNGVGFNKLHLAGYYNVLRIAQVKIWDIQDMDWTSQANRNLSPLSFENFWNYQQIIVIKWCRSNLQQSCKKVHCAPEDIIKRV